jgi:hypothetical protein
VGIFPPSIAQCNGFSTEQPLITTLSIEESLLSYAQTVTIVNHIARATFNTQAEGVYESGHIKIDLQFTAPGTVKGHLRGDIPTRSKRFGICANTLKFTATT